jgi:hypothetical protein
MDQVYIHTKIPKKLKTRVAQAALLTGEHENVVFTNALARGLNMAKKKAAKKTVKKTASKKKGY